MTLRVLLHIDIKDGLSDQFEQLWQRHSAFVATLPDNHGQSLLRRRDDPSRFVVTSDWTDEPAFRTFERSPQQQQYLQRLWPIRAGGQMILLDLVSQP